MEVLHRAKSGFDRVAKVIEEAGEGESKKVLIEYLKCKKRAWVAVESLVQGPLVKLDCGTPAGGGQARWLCIGKGS